MLTLNTLSAPAWARKKSKRLGRGNGSGKGTYSARGMNGQNSRSGGGVPDWFEGGQTPLFRRMPKLKGFSNAPFKTKFQIINLSDVQMAADKWLEVISTESLREAGLISGKPLPLKLLGKGDLTAKLTITVDAASHWAKQAVEKAWGTLNILAEAQ